MIKNSVRAFKLNGFWLSWIKAGREYALQTVADGICFVCLLEFAVCFWVLHYVLLCSAKRRSSKGKTVSFFFTFWWLLLSGAGEVLKGENIRPLTVVDYDLLQCRFEELVVKSRVKHPATRELEAQIETKKVLRRRRKQANMFQMKRKEIWTWYTMFVCSVLQSRKQ